MLWHYRYFPGTLQCHGGAHLELIIMIIHVCTCEHMCACMGHPSSHPTHIHPPPRGRTKISYTIKLEQIKIFQFCLKILDLWIFLHSSRLSSMCRWRGSKKVHLICYCQAPGKIFPAFTPEPDRPCFDWYLMIFDLLTYLRPFQIAAESKTKVQNLTLMSILL